MKKLLVIAVIFALVAGAAFAETTVGGSVEINWMIATDDGIDYEDGVTPSGQEGDWFDGTWTNGLLQSAAFFLSTTNDDGNYGGMAKFAINGLQPNADRNWERAPEYITWERAFIWWQPIEQLKLFLGKDGDGLFNTANLIRWGHHQMPRNISVEGWEAGNYLLGNWDAFGFAVMVYPIEGLEINLALPLPEDAVGGFKYSGASSPHYGAKAKHEDVFKAIQLQAGYNVDGVGKFFLTFQGEQGGDRIGLTYQGAQFVEGLSFEVGFSYELLSDEGSKYYKKKFSGTEYVCENKSPLKIGLGVHYASGDFGVKTRFFLQPDKDKAKVAGLGDVDGFFYFMTDLMPYYNLGFGTVYLNIRIETLGKNAKDDDIIGWHVNPYLRMGMGGAGDWRVGARFESNTDDDAKVKWLIATSWVLNF